MLCCLVVILPYSTAFTSTDSVAHCGKWPIRWRITWTRSAATGSCCRRSTPLGAIEEFVDLPVPELQRRGRYRRDYTGTTSAII
jgi:hypothetical protein